jgi:N-glycosylase/DNA lyase
VDLARTLASHGFVDLAPMRPDPDSSSLEITLPTGRGRPRTVRIHPGSDGQGAMTVLGPDPSPAALERLTATVRHVLRLDADLSAFYAMAAGDPDLAWATAGAGRMVRAPTVFEDVVKTICTTNCAWSATRRMVHALVEHLGEPAPGAPPSGPFGRAFPTAERMAEAGEAFYREVARTGYRGAYLLAISRAVAAGELDLEALADPELPEAEVERRLLALPGIGPYAAAHVMMTLGRYHRLVLDSWTRPTYARRVSDREILRRFRRYGPYAGLAFWLVCTRDWVG